MSIFLFFRMRIINVTVHARWSMTNIGRDLDFRFAFLSPAVNSRGKLITLAPGLRLGGALRAACWGMNNNKWTHLTQNLQMCKWKMIVTFVNLEIFYKHHIQSVGIKKKSQNHTNILYGYYPRITILWIFVFVKQNQSRRRATPCLRDIRIFCKIKTNYKSIIQEQNCFQGLSTRSCLIWWLIIVWNASSIVAS